MRDELIAASGLQSPQILDGQLLESAEGQQWLSDLQPDWLISFSFGYFLGAGVRAIPKLGALNVHPALLPFNKGSYPNVWSIVDKTPAGVTLHFMDEGLDTGDIVAQDTVTVSPTDTGASLYHRLEEASIDLFKKQWPSIRAGVVPRHPQLGEGTTHRKTDVDRIDCIDPNGTYRAQDLIDLLRARTFPPYYGAYLDLGDRKVYLRLELSDETPKDRG
jgi:methionyl-tRNA formyltransferase